MIHCSHHYCPQDAIELTANHINENWIFHFVSYQLYDQNLKEVYIVPLKPIPKLLTQSLLLTALYWYQLYLLVFESKGQFEKENRILMFALKMWIIFMFMQVNKYLIVQRG